MTARGGGTRALAVFACAALLAGCGHAAVNDSSDYAYAYDPAVLGAMSAAPEIPKETPTPAPERMVVDDRKWFTLTVPLRWVMLESDSAHVVYAPSESSAAYVRADVVRFPGAWRLQPAELARSIACALSGAEAAKDAVMGIWQNVPMLAVNSGGRETGIPQTDKAGEGHDNSADSKAGTHSNATADSSSGQAPVSNAADSISAGQGSSYRVYCVAPDTAVIFTFDDGGDPAVTAAVEAVRSAFAVKASGATAGEGGVQEYAAKDLLTGLTDVIAGGMKVEPGKPLGKAFPQPPIILDGKGTSVQPGEVSMLHMGFEKASFFVWVRNEGEAAANAENCTLCGVELFAMFAADEDRMDGFKIGSGFEDLTGKLGAPRYATDMHGEWCLDGQTLIAYFEDDAVVSMMVLWQTEAERDERRKEYLELQRAAESAAAATDVLNQIPLGGQAEATQDVNQQDPAQNIGQQDPTRQDKNEESGMPKGSAGKAEGSSS